MTVSRLGSRPNPYAPAATGARRVLPVEGRRNDFDSLTDSDRRLIFEVTGLDPARQASNAFAKLLAAERAAGHLTPGQEITALYLKDLDRRYARGGGTNPVAPYLEKAVAYLSGRGGARAIDVTA